MRHTVLQTKSHRGVALLMVILIAALAFVGVVAALSFIRPRTAMVKGESAADRALSCADGIIDRVVDQINGFGLSYAAETNPSSTSPNQDSAMNTVMLQLLEKVNGPPSGGNTDSLTAASARTQTYLINAATNDIFLFEHGTGTIGNELNTGKFDRITSLALSPVYEAVGLAGLRQKYPGGNWFGAVTGAQYNMVTDSPGVTNPDSWTLTCTAWSVQQPDIKRTVQAQVQKGNLGIATNLGTPGTPGIPGTPDTTPWYISIAPTSGQPGTLTSFADFVFLSREDVAFAKSSVVTGDVMSNGAVWNGGWIEGMTTAVGNVYDTDRSGNGPGHFGANAEIRSVALADGTAKRYQDPANFPNGQAQINAAGNSSTGAQGVYRITSGADPATIEFLANGTLKINGGSAVSMPANGLIYVRGRDVKVHGVVNGRVTVVADEYSTGGWSPQISGGDIDIDGNLTYAHDPVLVDGVIMNTTPDALGLLAEDNIVLDRTYYASLASRTDKRELDVDAAAMAVNGWIGIDPNASSHLSTTTPHYTLVWRGARIFASFDNAPEVSSGGWTQGYEVKQSKYDYGLKNYMCPPGFPYTHQANSPPVAGESGRLQQLIEDKDTALLNTLRGMTVSSLTMVKSGENWYGDQHAYYHVHSSDGKDYYRGMTTVGGTPGTLSTPGTDPTYTGAYSTADTLYRLVWREAIGTPLQPLD